MEMLVLPLHKEPDKSAQLVTEEMVRGDDLTICMSWGGYGATRVHHNLSPVTEVSPLLLFLFNLKVVPLLRAALHYTSGILMC